MHHIHIHTYSLFFHFFFPLCYTLVITNKDLPSNNIDKIITIPDTHKFLSPIVSIIPLQLLSYFISKEKGLDVDKPRNLAKSVTVE